MSFEVDRYSPAWAHIALCADLTWTTEPPDEFIIANQRLWAQHCRISQVLQDAAAESQNLQKNNELTDKRSVSSQSQENGSCSGRRSVKDVIPESRLAQFYGNFYYDEVREKCYTSPNERPNGRGYNGQGCENSDLTECWMLPEVEYWFRKLVDDSPDRSFPRRRRQYRMLTDDDFERWDSAGARAAGEEAALAARVLSVRPLWAPQAPRAPRARAPSPPPIPRKIRARRRQPRRLAALAPPPPAYCLEVPAQLFCDPTCKFQFDPPRPPQLTECQRAMGRLSASVQAAMRASAARCPPYRGTNVSRYAPTGQRPARCPDRRYGVWWPRDHPSPRLDHRFHLTHLPQTQTQEQKKAEPEEPKKEPVPEETTEPEPKPEEPQTSPEKPESSKCEEVAADGQQPSTSAAALDTSLRKKRLYSTVLSMSAPAPLNLSPVGCVRLTQKLVAPGLLKLNPKIVLPSARIRPPNVDNKFEELEKEALEQYKASDESIDTKFRELEKQAVEQYSTSNSNTSCSSGNSAEKGTSSPAAPEEAKNKKQPAKFHKEKAVDSVVIYSQNFPDLNAKGHTSSVMNLKNFHTPPRGEKKEQTHRPSKLRSLKNDSQRAASDTDYEAREAKGHKGPMRWTLHVVPPKKRHLTLCVSDFSSDEEMEDASGSIKDAGPRMKNHVGSKLKMSAHGAGDLHPIMRKT
ncbi:uncharacterized protein LOC114361512 [Ostrinia furnacalis]|uniref:uncharacterized protein LOC114361512 n=2 Tax=Ostrinia TaxID=29056 RepID=UPI0010406709|nr:uncharacterized protein LOC114361512 [Ostrinia furnacalis]